jgi:hypothetical protein
MAAHAALAGLPGQAGFLPELADLMVRRGN